MTGATDYSRYFPQVQAGALVLVVNRRLARFLAQDYGRWQLGRDQAVWPTPNIAYLYDWLRQCWAANQAGELEPDKLLLETWQERHLWTEIIRGDQSLDLINLSHTARLAQQAWKLIQEWRLSLSQANWAGHRDTRTFMHWAEGFVQRCQTDGWLSGAELAEVIGSALRAEAIPAPAQVLLAGFDQPTPRQCWLFDTLIGQGSQIERLAFPQRRRQVVRVALADGDAEMAAAASWARDILAADAHATVGIVVPDLHTHRAAITAHLEDALHPGAVLPGNAEGPRSFNLTLGRPLKDYPLVDTALRSLRLAQAGRLPSDAIGALLRTPFWRGADSESAQRATLDARLRDDGGLTASIEQLRRLADNHSQRPRLIAARCPILCRCLQELLTETERCADLQSPAGWAATFSRLLAALGWPGERGLDSQEYQTAGAWNELLDAMARLSPVAKTMTFAQALSWLDGAAVESVFQPQQAETPIQVLGTLEAAGLPFEHLWLMGMHDQDWPAKVAPNAFIPQPLQRLNGLPNASPEHELGRARRLVECLTDDAEQVVISYPRRDGDRPLRPSPLIVTQSEESLEGVCRSIPSTYAEAIRGSTQMESIVDQVGPGLTGAGSAAGGAGLFKDQAACPFRAFATHRLGAASLGAPGLGLDAAQRGTLVHDVLEAFWSQVSGLAQLLSLSEQEVSESIGKAVHHALGVRRDSLSEPALARLEALRLQRLVEQWLVVERRRAPFEVVQTEATHKINLDGIDHRLRVDRVDRLEDGSHCVIDYKTGAVTLNSWFGERPDEPQLPLYALALGESCKAVAFARVAAGECDFSGVSDTPTAAAGVGGLEQKRLQTDCESWPQLVSEWRRVLTALAAAYRAGRAEVDPKDPPSTCTYCDLGALCRIDELLERGNADD